MPLATQCSRAAFEANVGELIRAGHPRGQAVAIAARVLRQACGAPRAAHLLGAARPALGPVPKEALAYFKRKRIKPGFSYQDVWKEEHNFAFTVAKIMEKQILADVRSSVERAIKQGTPLAEWSKQVKPLLDKSGWSDYGTPEQEPRRLRTIYQTNMRVARAAGQWDRAQRVKRVLPYLVYQLGPSEVHRPLHAAWDGLVLPVDDSFWDSHYPPNGWGCKCHVRQVSVEEADRLGGPSDRPPDDSVQFVDPSGHIELVPRGVDPAFNYNPGRGESRQAALDRALREAGG